MRRILSLFAVAALMVALTAMPALAAQQKGLVNVSIEDNVVQIPVGIAANICDVDVVVLASQIADTGSASCDAAVNQDL